MVEIPILITEETPITVEILIMEEILTMEEHLMSAQLFVELMLMIMDLEFVSVKVDLLKLVEHVSLELLVEPIKSELLMEDAVVKQDLLTIMEFALNVLLELSGALPQANASLSVVKTQLMMRKQRNACVYKVSV